MSGPNEENACRNFSLSDGGERSKNGRLLGDNPGGGTREGGKTRAITQKKNRAQLTSIMGNGALLGFQETGEHGDYRNTQDSIDRWLKEQDQLRECFSGKREKFHGIRITGAAGIFSSRINSIFVATGEMYNKRMLYKSPNHWLRYASDGKWTLSKTRDMEENSFFRFLKFNLR